MIFFWVIFFKSSKNKSQSLDDEYIQKDNEKNTVIDNVVNENETLFLKAIHESQIHIEKAKQKTI